MSSDFQKVLVTDDVLCVTDKLTYGIYKGAAQRTPYRYEAISQSSASITFNVQTPSESVVFDRKVIWNGSVVLKIVYPANAVPVGAYAINYGVTDALAPFPLHAMTTVQSVTINNNTVSMNTADLLPALMRFNDKRQLMRYNGMTPNMFDTYGLYSDAVQSVNNPLGSYKNVGDNDLIPRGAYPINWISGSPDGSTPQPVGVGGVPTTIYVSYTCSEPLLIPPFIWAMPQSNNQGFYGIINLNAVFNVNGNPNRVWRSANPWASQATITIENVSGHRLIMNQFSPHPDQLMPSRNVVPYATLPRFITPVSQTINPAFSVNGAGVYIVTPNAQGTTITSTNLQLNTIPDKLVCFIRRRLSDQTAGDADYFLAIRGVSINFNNNSGILSTATPMDLYHFSVEAGSNQSWEEFYGLANVPSADPATGSNMIPTTGSLLCLDFGRHIQLSESYYAPGSLGNFQFQINLNVVNQFPAGSTQATNTNWELVIVTIQSGLFVNERGTSSSYTGIVTRADVLEVSTQETYKGSDARRMVGGGFLDSLKSVYGKLAPKLPALAGIAKHGLSMMDNAVAKSASKALGDLGYGRSGGGTSGGRSRMHSKLLE